MFPTPNHNVVLYSTARIKNQTPASGTFGSIGPLAYARGTVTRHCHAAPFAAPAWHGKLYLLVEGLLGGLDRWRDT